MGRKIARAANACGTDPVQDSAVPGNLNSKLNILETVQFLTDFGPKSPKYERALAEHLPHRRFATASRFPPTIGSKEATLMLVFGLVSCARA